MEKEGKKEREKTRREGDRQRKNLDIPQPHGSDTTNLEDVPHGWKSINCHVYGGKGQDVFTSNHMIFFFYLFSDKGKEDRFVLVLAREGGHCLSMYVCMWSRA